MSEPLITWWLSFEKVPNDNEGMKNPDTKKVEDFLNTDIKPEDKKKIIDRIDSLINKYWLEIAIKNTFEWYSDKMWAFNIKKDPLDIINREEIYTKFKEKFNLETKEAQEEKNQPENQNKIEKPKDNKVTILEDLLIKWIINQTSFDTIYDKKTWKIDLENKNLDEKDKTTIVQAFDKIEKKNESKELNKQNLQNDYSKIDELKDYNIETKDGWFKDEVLNKIWWNYINFPTKEWENEKKIATDNLQTAIKITKNDFLETLNQNSSSLNENKQIKIEEAIKKIDSWDLKTWLEWINSLYEITYSHIWTLAKAKEYDKESLLKEWNNIKEKYNKIKKEIQELKLWATIDNEKLQKLESQKTEILKEAKKFEKENPDIIKEIINETNNTQNPTSQQTQSQPQQKVN